VSGFAQVVIDRHRANAGLTRSQIAPLVHGLGDLLDVLRDADPADKAEVYRQLGVRLTYHPGEARVTVEAQPTGPGTKECVGGGT
jgi:hypothetical protein